MAKRFTDIGKWRNEWFRTLPIKAKLTWIYLCDECCAAGIWKADYGLASFQLDFKITAEDLQSWFGRRVHFFAGDKVLLVPFFEFQYGESKDSWSAKVTAKNRLESLGFQVIDNKVQITQSPHSDPTVGVECDTLLIRVKGKGKGIKKGGMGENKILRSQIENAYSDLYPLKKGKSRGVDIIMKGWTEQDSIVDLIAAITRYRDDVQAAGTEKKYIKHFSTFASEWRDWVSPEAGTSSVIPSQEKTGVEMWLESELAKEKVAAG